MINFSKYITSQSDFDKLEQIDSVLNKDSYEKFTKSLGPILEDDKASEFLQFIFQSIDLFPDTSFSRKFIRVGDLKPIQSKIDYKKTITKIVDGTADPNSILTGYDIVIGMPLLVFNDTYIIDGHHRWSQACVLNLESKISCISIMSEISLEDILKRIQIVIATDLGEVPSSKINSKNLYDVGEKELVKLIMDEYTYTNLSKIYFFGDEVIQEPNLYASIDDMVVVCAKYMMKNIKKMPKPDKGKAYDRSIMPQTNESPILIQQVTDEK